MAKKDKAGKPDSTTETRIKEAARTVFHKKGYAAARTRDIAELAGINLALLNYYFRSKEKLFAIIMMETFQQFVQTLKTIFNDESTSLDGKIEIVVSSYIELFRKQPAMPIFILSELRNNPEALIDSIKLKQVVMHSAFIRQLKEQIKSGRVEPINPLHFVMNLTGLTIFPFVASPMLRHLGDLSEKDFDDLMLARKEMIPRWIKAMLKTQ